MADATDKAPVKAADKPADGAGEVVDTAISPVLSGVDNFIDGNTHVGIAVRMTSSGVPSTLVIPDAGGVKDGAPVFLTRPIRLEGKNLKKFLIAKGVLTLKTANDTSDDPEVNETVGKFLNIATISLEAFYFTTKGPLLMMFDLSTKGTINGQEVGVIGALTDDPSLSQLFDVTGASVRIFRCPKGSYRVLEKYAAALSGE